LYNIFYFNTQLVSYIYILLVLLGYFDQGRMDVNATASNTGK